jgi:membrane protein YdbS with pleckstrin-like domain
MNSKWLINKLAAILVSLTVVSAVARYYRVYNFNISANDRLLFWVPLAIVVVLGIAVYAWTFKAKKDDVDPDKVSISKP